MQHDGRFELYYRDGWAWLTVTAPLEDGRPVYHEDVVNRMRLLGVPSVPASSVREIVKLADGRPARLVEWPNGARLASDITVTVADDEMSATVVVTRPLKGAAAPIVDDLVARVRAYGVVEGVNEPAIAAILRDEAYGERVEIAHGESPVDAKSARIEYSFDPDRGRPYLSMPFDRINLRELNFIENKEAGDLLAELRPPTTPKDGRTVTGKVLPARREIEPIQLTAGPNTEKNPEATKIRATADGNVRLVKGAVIIEPVVVVENVDYSTGNIRFDGSVVVQKDVADGFVIEAGGDVQIGRGVGKATIRAGGNVLLKAGINGNGEGQIECDGDLYAKFIESSTVRCHGNVFVEEAIMHSHVIAWKSCALSGRRSEIIASNLVVAGSLWCKKLGSVSEGPVVVSIGIDPDLLVAFADSRRRLESAETELDEAQHQLEQVERALVDGRTDDKLYAARDELAATVARLRKEAPATRHEVHELRESLDASRESRVVVEDTLFNGAVVLFGTSEYRAPEKGARKTVLRRGPEGIVEEGFNSAEPPAVSFE